MWYKQKNVTVLLILCTVELLYNEGPRDRQKLGCAITKFRYIEDHRGSFSYILLYILGQRKSFVIPREGFVVYGWLYRGSTVPHFGVFQ